MERLLCIGLLLTLVSFTRGTITQAPQDEVYHRGTDTNGYVTCIVSTPVDSSVFWSVYYSSSDNDNGIIYTNALGIFENVKNKFSVNADALTSGNFTLVIKDLDRDDTGSYTCQHGQDPAITAIITVADPPGKPVLTVPTDMVENQTQTFICTSEGGYPSPNITWTLGSTALPSNEFTTTISNDGNRVTSRLTRPLSNLDDGKLLLCEAENILRSDSTSETLNVKYTPRVQVTPQNLIVMRNTPFNLTCAESSNPARTSLVWKSGSSEIASQVTVHSVGGGISEDTTYTCDVRSSLGSGEGSTRVTVHYAPEVTITQEDSMTIEENDDLVLNCVVSAKPDATVKWYRGDLFLGASPELVIREATRENRGPYRCEAKNTPAPTGAVAAEKTSTASIEVDVQYAAQKPIISVSPISSSEEYRAGQRIELSCSTSTDRGNPEREIKWYRDNSVNSIFSGENFVIESPQVDDSGSYRCQAENSVAQVSSDTKSVTIIDVPELVIADRRREQNVTVGTPDYKLECSYRGLPAPQIVWYKNNEEISDPSMYTINVQSNTEDNSKYEKVTSTLEFKGSERNQLMVSDFAEYRCLASNSAGESTDNFQRQVNVLFPPQLDGYGKVATDVGAQVEIPCTVLSYPPATEIIFKRNGEEISTGGRYRLRNIETNVDNMSYKQSRSLVITSTSEADYGNYICEATNSEDTASAMLTLMRTTVPDAPSDIEVSSVEWGEAMITWSPGFDGGKQQRFQVYYGAAGEERKMVETIELYYNLQGLIPTTSYNVKVYGENVLGTSQSFTEVDFETEGLVIPTPKLVHNEEENRLEVEYNSSDYCVKYQGINEDKTATDLTDCVISPEPYDISDNKYTQYRAVACVPGRDDVCVDSPVASANIDEGGNGPDKVVIIAVVVAVVVVILVLGAVMAIFVMRRKRRLHKADNSAKSGQINHIITPKGVPGEVHYSNSGYQVNSDLELDDDADGLPYGEFRNNRVESPVSASAPFQNLDYVYASVQKKPSEQNKLNENAANAYNVQSANRMNIQDPSSISDNSEADQYDGPPSPYRGPDHDLSFLGDGALAFHRYPSMSESNYSSPESKQLKKVVYEVIV